MSALTSSWVVASKCILGLQATDCHRWQVQTALTCFIHEELMGFFHLRIITVLAWENSRHLATLPLVSLPNDVWETSAEIPYWRCVTTQIWVMLLIWLVVPHRKFISTIPRHQYGISALVSPTSFDGETSGSIAKCRLFSQANYQHLVVVFTAALSPTTAIHSLLLTHFTNNYYT